MTAVELLRCRHEPYRQELIAGRLQEIEPPGAEHGLVATRIGMLLGRHVEASGLGAALVGDVGFQLASDPDTGRAGVVVDPPRRSATIDRALGDIRIVAADEPLDLDDVVSGFAPRVAELFA